MASSRGREDENYRKEEDKAKREVRELIKTIEGKLEERMNPERESVYYSNPHNGGYKRKEFHAAREANGDFHDATETHNSQHEQGASSRIGIKPVQLSASGREFSKERGEQGRSKEKNQSILDIGARTKYYQLQKQRNLEKLVREREIEERTPTYKRKEYVPSASKSPQKRRNSASRSKSPHNKKPVEPKSQSREGSADFHPKINDYDMSRSNNDRMRWLKERDQKIADKRILDNVFDDHTYKPKINSKSKELSSNSKHPEVSSKDEKKRKTKEEFVKEYLENEKKTYGNPKTTYKHSFEPTSQIPLKSEKNESNLAYSRKSGKATAEERSKSKDSKFQNMEESNKKVAFTSPKAVKRTESEIISDFNTTGRSKSKKRSVSGKRINPSTGSRESYLTEPTSILKMSNPSSKKAKKPLQPSSKEGIPLKNHNKKSTKMRDAEEILVKEIIENASNHNKLSDNYRSTPSKSKSPNKKDKRSTSRSKKTQVNRNKNSPHSKVKNSPDSEERLNERKLFEKIKLKNELEREKKLTSLIYKDAQFISPSKKVV